MLNRSFGAGWLSRFCVLQLKIVCMVSQPRQGFFSKPFKLGPTTKVSS